MKYFFCILILSSLISSVSNAQGHYEPGYVVNLQNDTLKGFIDYRGWENNPIAISFKSNLNQPQPEKFSTDNTVAFAITGTESYRRYTFTKSNAITNIDKLQTGIDTTRSLGTYFLKAIIKGKKVSLYSFTDTIKTRFYTITDKDTQPRELDYYVYYPVYSNDLSYSEKNSHAYKTQYNFRSQLREIASIYDAGSPKLEAKIKYAYYKENDIANIVELINGEPSQSVKQSADFGIRFFLGAGIRSTKLNLSGGETFFSDNTIVTNAGPAFSGGMDIILNKHTQMFIFRTEIDFASNHYVVPPQVVNGSGTTGSLDFKQHTATLTPQLIYNLYSTNKLKVFVDGGFALNFSSYNKYYYMMNFGNGASVIKTGNYPEFEKFWVGFPVKAGVVISNTIEIYASHSFPTPITQVMGAGAADSYYQAGVNYLFK